MRLTIPISKQKIFQIINWIISAGIIGFIFYCGYFLYYNFYQTIVAETPIEQINVPAKINRDLFHKIIDQKQIKQNRLNLDLESANIFEKYQ